MRAALVPVLLVTAAVTMVTGMALSRSKRQNYDALLQNKAFVESQINCVLGRGQCDRIGHRIKYLVPEVVRTKECKSCTDDERGNVQKVADHVKNNYPKEWNEIKHQYTEEDDDKTDSELDSGEDPMKEEGRQPRQEQQIVEEELEENHEPESLEEFQDNARQGEVQEAKPENGANGLNNDQPEETPNVETSTPI